jgi:hypothetical protein
MMLATVCACLMRWCRLQAGAGKDRKYGGVAHIVPEPNYGIMYDPSHSIVRRSLSTYTA